MSARKFAAHNHQKPRRRSTGSLRDLREVGNGRLSDPDEDQKQGLRPSSYFGGSASSALSDRCDSCTDLTRSCSCEMCLWEFSPDGNPETSAEKAKLQNLVLVSRKQEEDVIDQLVQSHIEIDALHEEAMRDSCRIRQLTEENTRLQEQLIDSLAGSIYGDRTQINGVTNRLVDRIHELERELEESRSRGSGNRDGQQQQDRWKILEIRREKLQARRELERVKQHLSDERARTGRLKDRVRRARQARRNAESEVKLLQDRLTGDNSASDSLSESLSQELRVLRLETARQQESLKESGRLREQLDEMHTEVAGLRARLSRLANVEEQSEHWRKKCLALEIENRRLRKHVEQLRRTSVRHSRYHYVTSF